jgi:hypothetical protein
MIATGADLQALREHLGLTVIEFGRALGYAGRDKNISRDIRRYELMDVVPPGVLIRARALAQGDVEALQREARRIPGDLRRALAKPRPRMGGDNG